MPAAELGNQQAPKRILAIVSHFPMPQNHGDALRRLMILRALLPMGAVTAACVARTETSLRDIDDLAAELPGARVIVATRTRAGGRTFANRITRSIVGPLRRQPPWILQQWSPGLGKTLRQIVATEGAFDAVLFVGEASGWYARINTGGLRVWDKSNVLLASELSTFTEFSSARARLRSLLTAGLTYLFEKRVLDQIDRVWVTSAEEGIRLQKHYGRPADSIIPSMVDMPPRLAVHAPDSRILVWVSTFDYKPNWDGLVRFLHANDDYLRRTRSVVRIAGARSSMAQRRYLDRYPHVDFRGYVNDLYEVLDGAAAAVVPVWSGAGVKLKTLTFMSHGIPVVGTTVAMEGIPVAAAAAVVDSGSGFSAALEDLTPEQLRRASQRALSLVSRDFSRESFTERIADAMAPLLECQVVAEA